MTNLSFPPSDTRATKIFDKIHMDLKSFPVQSYHKYNYMIVFLDNYSLYGWITLLRQKSDADAAVRQFLAAAHTQYNCSIKEVMIDAGGEFKSTALTNFLKDLGIHILTSVSHEHQQNGCAECFIQTLMDKAQAVCLDACLPQSYWEFAVQFAIHVYNRTPLHHTSWCTPYETLHSGEVPSAYRDPKLIA